MTRRREASSTSRATGEDLSGPRLRYPEDVLQVHEVIQFGLLLHREAGLFLLGNQFGDPALSFGRGAIVGDSLRRSAAGYEIDDFQVRRDGGVLTTDPRTKDSSRASDNGQPGRP